MQKIKGREGEPEKKSQRGELPGTLKVKKGILDKCAKKGKNRAIPKNRRCQIPLKKKMVQGGKKEPGEESCKSGGDLQK